MSKILSDRLDPYLNKSLEKQKVPRHSSFSINTPVPIYYD